MRFISLTIKRGSFQDRFDFASSINIIHSKKNSVGKTTLIRFLIFALGYPIPNTRGINFNNYELMLEILSASGDSCLIKRVKNYITFTKGDTNYSFSLPFELNDLHAYVFGINNYEVLDNLLGAYYVDQEKGWTLLNRGKVIGNIHFSIEGLIRGLSNRSNHDISMRLLTVKRELQKYRHMLDISQYQAEINALGENIAFDAPIDDIESRLDVLYSKRKPISDELERLKSVIRKNISFKNYVGSMQLRVISKSGEEIPVNENTIVDFKDNVEYLVAKRKIIAEQLTEIDRKINTLKQHQQKENIIFDVQTYIQTFDADVLKMRVDTILVKRFIGRLERERSELEKSITNSVKQNNPIISELHHLISKYATELGVDERYVLPSNDYIFTSDLKSLTGAIFHKIVFAFKISYIKLITAHTGVKLPVVLDSPSGREVDKINVADMMTILARDFTEHQIIIASINLYNFHDTHIIELKKRLLSYES